MVGSNLSETNMMKLDLAAATQQQVSEFEEGGVFPPSMATIARNAASVQRISYREWNCTKALEEGSLVCFTNQEGLPLKVVRHSSQKYWELVPTTILDKDERVPFLPPECAFAVLKDERTGRYGFRSLVAGGRLLQATKNKRDPPRVTNFNFGPWETWQLTNDALKNCAWKTVSVPTVFFFFFFFSLLSLTLLPFSFGVVALSCCR